MPRRKEVARKNIDDNASSSRRATNEREKEVHHMASWFNNTQALNNYIQRWEKRPFVAPRYINFEFLQSSNFNSLINVLEAQHLGGLVMMENDYYPDLVSGSLSSLRFVGTTDGGYIEAYMGGRIRVIPLSAIASICNLSMDGVPFRGGLRAHDSWDNYSLQDGLATIGYRGNVVGCANGNKNPSLPPNLHNPSSWWQSWGNSTRGCGQCLKDIRFVGRSSSSNTCSNSKEKLTNQLDMVLFGVKFMSTWELMFKELER
ncbi:hypothetical protein PIB30_103341 [Stylosanthes scabra]|uniref:Uncharacterized protein n=1 Tax=Stylosanthes scabra TaxID=79078 RepID=A0ABU6SY91_9FABA|nr:hypothetical protein [Stylosanthes scabra]